MQAKTVLWLVTGAGLLLCAGFGQLLRSSFAADSGLKTGGIPVQVKQAQHCSAFAPVDWSFWTNPAASTAEALSADRTMYAGWGVTAVNQAMRPYYGDLYGDPETSIRFLTNQILTAGLGDPSGMRYTSPPQPFLDYFLLRRFESAKHAGEVFYKIYPGGAPQMYVESVYWAIAAKSRGAAGLQTAAGVAVSIRCVTQFQYTPPASTASKGKRAARAGCGAGGSLRGYQKELGTQYAHSPSTGQNFLLDPSTQWNATGPQGAGYYRQVGNDYEKLEPGRDDDC
jgi:hypothetical protein